MKKIFASGLASIVLLVLGICLLVNPMHFISLTCTVLGAVLIVIAAVRFLSSYKKNSVKYEAANCVILLVLGIILVVLRVELLSVIPLAVGICFLTYGLLKLKAAFAFKNVNPDIFLKLAYSSIIGIILAVLIIAFHGLATDVVLRLIGALLIYNALENIFSAILAKKFTELEKNGKKEHDKIEGEYEESEKDGEKDKK